MTADQPEHQTPISNAPRHVVWWSAGAASTVTAMLVLREHPDALLVYTDPGGEHKDNARFRDDVEKHLGVKVIVLRSEKYVDHWDVFEKTRFLVGPGGARCTIELKKRLRQQFERPDDIQYFGYHSGERGRIDGFRAANPEVDLRTPLIDHHLFKPDCLGIVERAGLELPITYRQGFRNANCIGCPHGGMGYWNMIRKHYPDAFDRMAVQERELDNAVCRPGGIPVWLDELDPDRGEMYDEPETECSLLCVSAPVDITAKTDNQPTSKQPQT